MIKFNLKLKYLLPLLVIFFMPSLYATSEKTTAPVTKNVIIPILCYHRVIPNANNIYDITPETLEKQLRFMQDHGYHPITALQFISLQKSPQLLPDKPVVITFDDGCKSHYQNVFPILKKLGLKATFFVYPSAVLNKESKKYITWPELQEMVQAGMDIECHTLYHPFLVRAHTNITDPKYLQWLNHQLKDSKTILENHLNIKVKLLAYPFGRFNRLIESKSIEAGYEGIFTINGGTNFLHENPMRLKRLIVNRQISTAGLESFFHTKPLPLEITSPIDTSIVAECPVIEFRLAGLKLPKVHIQVGNDNADLYPDANGNFTYQIKKPEIGFNLITISGYDEASTHGKDFYLNSWSFDYLIQDKTNDMTKY
ncbi:MAG TPA: polysaccharide deacetylase family protein [Bacillota bacterium]